MSSSLLKVMEEELEILKILLNLLEKQYNLLTGVEKDIVEISKIAEEIDVKIKQVASFEIEKKNILKNQSLLSVVESYKDEYALYVYNETLKVLDTIAIQKDTNNIFIKQQLFFTKSLIRAITPKQNADIYDSYGKIKK